MKDLALRTPGFLERDETPCSGGLSGHAEAERSPSRLRRWRSSAGLSSTPEEDLVLTRKARAGLESAVQALVERLGCVPAMLRIRERKVGLRLDAEEREETVQETLAAMWAKLSSFDGRTPLEAWVYGFVVREHYKALARRQRQRIPEDPDGQPAPAAHDSLPLGASVLHSTIDSSVHRAPTSCACATSTSSSSPTSPRRSPCRPTRSRLATIARSSA